MRSTSASVAPAWAAGVEAYCAELQWVLLAPERVLFPCATSVTIIERLGEGRRVGELVTALAEEFEAPRATISTDVRQMLQGLADQGFLAVEMAHG